MRAHRDAVIAELESRLSGAVFKSSSVPAPVPSRYAVVHVARSSKPRTRFTGGQWRDIYTFTVHSTGVSEDDCLWVEERVNLLTGKTLAVTGRKLWPVEYITGQPPDLDDDGTAPLWFTVSQFDITSDPA